MISVLVLCTGNSARSILGEGLLNSLGAGRVRAHSAGSAPTGTPNPFALEELRRRGIDASFARSKSWDEFSGPEAAPIDLVITVCDSAAAETCPIWVGHPAQVHWGLPDPADVKGDDAARAAFKQTADRLEARISALLDMPLEDGIEALKPQIAALATLD